MVNTGGRKRIPTQLRKVTHSIRVRPHVSDLICKIALHDKRSVYSVLEACVTGFAERWADRQVPPVPFPKGPDSTG